MTSEITLFAPKLPLTHNLVNILISVSCISYLIETEFEICESENTVD